MPQPADWKVPSSVQPKPQDYTYDLERALSAVVAVHTIVPADAFSAETLGTERAGNGVLIRDDGVVLTIGYLITEAEQVWLAAGIATFIGQAIADEPERFIVPAGDRAAA